MRYFMHLGYDGSRYSGWQRQTSTSNTIQETIERALSRVLKQPITIYGCGRTDAGVHASQYIAQFDFDEPFSFDLKFRLNKNVPDDIAIFEVMEVERKRNSRYDAVSRTYDYFIHWSKDPVLLRHSSFYEGIKLDFELMEQCMEVIINTKDFKPWCKQADDYHNTLCHITDCRLFVNEEQGRMRFSITSNRFLRGMVRYCVSFLLKVGTGEITLEEFKSVLSQEEGLDSHAQQKRPALPNGLFLSSVTYPYMELENKHQLIRMMKVGLE